jgi:hypothetical protein
LSAAEQLAAVSQRARSGAKEKTAQPQEAETTAIAAVESLRSAIAAGLEAPRLNSPALAPLASRNDFESLRQTAAVADKSSENLAGE